MASYFKTEIVDHFCKALHPKFPCIRYEPKFGAVPDAVLTFPLNSEMIAEHFTKLSPAASEALLLPIMRLKVRAYKGSHLALRLEVALRTIIAPYRECCMC